ncbi:MAG: hypothetical protein ACOC2U_00210 [bacterium]
MNKTDVKNFVMSFREMEIEAARVAEKTGWEVHNTTDDLKEKLLLLHSEVSEMVEALRKDKLNAPSEKIPNFTNFEEELADLFLRGMHMSKKLNLKIAAAMIAKLEYNDKREFKHGNKLF